MAFQNGYSQPNRQHTNTGVMKPGAVEGGIEQVAPQAQGNPQAASDPQAFFHSIKGQYAPTQEGLQQMANDPQFQQAGWKLGNPNASGIRDSIIGPQGQAIDVIKGAMAGGGSGEWQWGAWGPAAGSWAANEGPVQAPYAAGGMSAPGGAPGTAGANNNTGYNPYTPGQLPTTALPTYTPGQVNQFNAPNQGAMNQLQQGALAQALQSGGSMNPQVVAQMKGVQQGQGAQMLQQQQQQAAGRMASMGRGDSGLADVQNRRMQDAMQANLLGGFRDIDINAAQTNFNDVLRASGALDSALGREAGTASDFYKTGLAGQMSQEELNQRGVASNQDAVRFALERALAQEGLAQSAAGLGEGSRQFDIGQALARAQMGQQNSQFYAGLGEQGRQYNMGYGLDAARLAAERERQYLSTLFGR